MAVDHGAAVARQMLDHRRHAAGEQPVGEGAGASSATRRRLGREGAAADRLGHAGRGDVEHRRAVDVDADLAQIVRDQPARAAAPLRGRPRRSSAASRPMSRAAGRVRHCGGRSRITRPPSWSIRTGRRAVAAPSARSSSVSARSWARSAQLRWNRMTPAGGSASSSSRSAGVERRPGDADDGRARRRAARSRQAHWPIGPTMKHWPPLDRIAPQAFDRGLAVGERAGLEAEQRPRAGIRALDLRAGRARARG